MAGRQQSQRGAALLVFVVLMVMATLTYLVNSFSPTEIELKHQRQTEAALALAKEALIGYALTHRDRKTTQTPSVPDAMYGYLPLPDLGEAVNQNTGINHPCNTEGCSKFNNSGVTAGETYVGHFPWQTLGTGPLRDGASACLWYAVSGTHQELENSTTMNWDTPGLIDPAAVNNSAAVGSGTGHDAPVAVIFAPGPATVSRPVDPATRCGGDYTVARYLDAQNARGLTITSADLFDRIRKHDGFRADLRDMLGKMARCWSTQLASLTPDPDFVAPPDKVARRIPDAPAACNTQAASAYGDDQIPKGYFGHYRQMILIARPSSGTFTVNGDSSCKGVILFSGPRRAGQTRLGTGVSTLSNYLEGNNLASLTSAGGTFSGDTERTAEAPRADGTDIAVCIPDPVVFNPSLVTSPTLIAGQQLVRFDAATGTLTLGRENSTTGVLGASAGAALFGCAWLADIRPLGNGLRTYFKLQFKKVGTSVGSNGIVFTLADAARNALNACGAAGNHLGYSGINASTPPIVPPKIGIEFDQSRNTGYTSGTSLTAGRHDPCYTCGSGTADSHVAIVYWGNAANNPTDGVADPDHDDNVHGFPLTPPAVRPPPTSPDNGSAGMAAVNLRGYPDNDYDGRIFHVRIELSPTRIDAPLAEDRSLRLLTQVWVLADSTTVTNQIAALQNTTRPISLLYPGLSPTVNDTASLYDVAETGSSCDVSTPCPGGQRCGSDGVCYRPALQTLRMGFTGAQRTSDQEVLISDSFTTWLP